MWQLRIGTSTEVGGESVETECGPRRELLSSISTPTSHHIQSERLMIALALTTYRYLPPYDTSYGTAISEHVTSANGRSRTVWQTVDGPELGPGRLTILKKDDALLKHVGARSIYIAKVFFTFDAR